MKMADLSEKTSVSLLKSFFKFHNEKIFLIKIYSMTPLSQ